MSVQAWFRDLEKEDGIKQLKMVAMPIIVPVSDQHIEDVSREVLVEILEELEEDKEDISFFDLTNFESDHDDVTVEEEAPPPPPPSPPPPTDPLDTEDDTLEDEEHRKYVMDRRKPQYSQEDSLSKNQNIAIVDILSGPRDKTRG